MGIIKQDKMEGISCIHEKGESRYIVIYLF